MKRKPVDLLNEIRMSRIARPYLSLLVVEGRTDSGFLRKLTCPNRCRLDSAQKVLARQTAELASKLGVKGVVALIDRDHDHLLGRLYQCENLIYSDENDLEVTILLSSAFDAFLHEYLNDEEQARIIAETGCRSISHFLLDAAGIIGALRYLSSVRTWDLKFRDLEAAEVFDFDRMEVDPIRLVRHILGSTTNPRVSETDATAALNSEIQSVEDISVFATGHDATRILALLLSSGRWTSYEFSVGQQEIERQLRLSFAPEYFRQTGMYDALRKWERSASPHGLFPDVACQNC